MIRVCHMTSVHSIDVRIFEKECKTLDKAGYEVFLIVQNDTDEVRDGVTIKGIKKPKNRIVRMTKTVRQLYRLALDCDAEIYHFHDPELIPVGMLLKRKGKKIIYDVHEDYSEDILNKSWIPALIRRIVASAFTKLEQHAVKRIDWIIAATPKIKQRFSYVTSNVVNINNYPILQNGLQNRSNEKIKTKKIAYIGVINRTRGIIEMIRALEYTDAILVLAGKFSSQKDYELAKSMRGWKQVDYRGHVSRSEIDIILNESAMGLVLFHPGPNHDDSQPNKLFEYMEAGLPVISSNFPIWKDIIEKNYCGLCVNPLNYDEIADAVTWVFNNPVEADIMGKNGRNLILKQYNWQTESKKLIRVYAELTLK